MSRSRLRVTMLLTLAIALSLFLCLFGNSPALRNGDTLGTLLREIEAVFRDPGTQWMVLLCLAVYCATFLVLGQSRNRPFRLWNNAPPLPGPLPRSTVEREKGNRASQVSRFSPIGWLIAFLGIGLLAYCLKYSVASKSTQALTLAGAATLALGTRVWTDLPKARVNRSWFVPVLLICFLIAASFWEPDFAWPFEYRGHSRAVGPWDNPNTFGVLMGTGVALAVGGAFRKWKIEDGRWFGFGRSKIEDRRLLNVICTVLCFVAAILMGRALFQSLSRGAWLATGCGVAYLAWEIARRKAGMIGKSGKRESAFAASVRQGEIAEAGEPHLIRPPATFSPSDAEKDTRCRERELHSCSSCVSWFKKNLIAISVIVLAAGVLVFWNFRHAETRTIRRAVSVANANDFSWRNRVAAWEGTLQMMAEKPWFGSGWNQPERMYENFYLQPRLMESAAIQMNDYLMLGATLGIPALFCFGAYIWLTLLGSTRVPRVQSGVPPDCSSDSFIKNPSEGFRRDAENSARDACAPHSPSSIHHPLSSSAWLQTTCRAGAIVLLVGFWFDGGLFKLATASTFWILLELGRVEQRIAKSQ